MPEQRISATELARGLDNVLERIQRRGDSFLVERDDEVIARILPPGELPTATLRDALRAWSSVGKPDSAFAADLEEVNDLDTPPEGAWVS